MMLSWILVLAFLVAVVPTTLAQQKTLTSKEASHRRDIFYAGGIYVDNAAAGGTIVVNQTYYERLIPAGGVTQKYPLLFIHGGGISGTQWVNKPDGNKGWASLALDKGFEVILIDEWSIGRSSDLSLPVIRAGGTVELVEIAFTAPELYKEYYQAQFHTQWPGTGTRGDPTFDAFFYRFGPLNFSPTSEAIFRTSVCAVLKAVGPSILVSHSVGGQYGFLATDGCPALVKAHVAYEADATPFGNYDAGTFGANASTPTRPYGIASVPVTYSPPLSKPEDLVRTPVGQNTYTDGLLSQYGCIEQAANPPPRQLVNVAKAPVYFLTGEASVHILYDQCLVRYLRQAGVMVTWVKLADVGQKGNGHFGMLEKNSDAIAKLGYDWIEKTVK